MIQKIVKKISELALLDLTEEELKKFSKDFDEIINYFKIVENLEGEPAFHPIPIKNKFREDKSTKKNRKKIYFGPKVKG